MSDLSAGLNEWRNITEVVRLTFQSLISTVQDQSQQIEELRASQRSLQAAHEELGARQAAHAQGPHAELRERLAAAEAALGECAGRAELGRQLADVARRQDVAGAVASAQQELRAEAAQRPTHGDLRALEAALSQAIGARAGADDLRDGLRGLRGLRALAESKADAAELGALAEQHAHAFDALQLQLSQRASSVDVAAALGLKADVELLAEKANAADVEAALKAKASRSAVVAALRKKADQEDTVARLALKADSAALGSLASTEQLGGAMAQRPDRATVGAMVTEATQRVLAHCMASVDGCVQASDLEQRLEARLQATQAAVEAHADAACADSRAAAAKELRQLREALGAKAASRDVEDAMTQLATLDELREGLALKAYDADLRALSGTVDTVSAQLAQKAGAEATEQAIQALQAAAGEAASSTPWRQELAPKADVKDVCTLLDTKANIDDVNAVLEAVNRELDTFASSSDLQTFVGDQGAINSALCAECNLGRWIWKSGRTKTGGAVPWNVQSVNSNPANFLWQADQTHVVAVTPGLYEIQFGVFSNKKPSVQLLVDGEAVLSAVNSSSYARHHSSGRLAATPRHSAGNVTGLTLLDFVALPANARVALTLSGEDGAEGFLGLRKL